MDNFLTPHEEEQAQQQPSVEQANQTDMPSDMGFPGDTMKLPEESRLPFADYTDSLQPEIDTSYPYAPAPMPSLPDGYAFSEDAQELPQLLPQYAQEQPSAEEYYELPQQPRKKRKKALRIVLFIAKWLLAIALMLAVAAAGLIGYLSVTEYTPAYAENAQRGAVNVTQQVPPLQTLRILCFNTGYAGLGEDADFFIDGGEAVNPDSEKTVSDNMDGITELLEASNADFLLLQEVDTDSARSFERNQWLTYEKALEDYESRFALNYSCDYVPYPLTERIGKVHSGIATYSRFDIKSATRYALPCPFSWPERVANMKRCFLVTRLPIENRTQELVLVNVHMEAYDDGEGKVAQTAQLMEFLEQEYAKGNYVIAGGDFNQSFPDALYEYPIKPTSEWQPGELGNLPALWSYDYDSETPTCRLLNQPYRPNDRETQYFVIDGYIVSPNVKVSLVKTLAEDFVYSDHNPVVLEFTLE